MGDGPISFRKYRAPAEREALIQKLLQERELHLAKERELEEWQRHESEGHYEGYAKKRSNAKPKSFKSERAISNRGTTHADPRSKSASRRSGFTRKTIDQVKQEVKCIEAQTCTFRPKINKNKVNPRTRQISREQHLKLLSAPKKKFWADQARARNSMEKRKEKECTFKPKINKQSDGKAVTSWRNGSKSVHRSRVSVEDRLHAEARERQIAQERTQQIWQEEQDKKHNFKPKVNPTSKEIIKGSDYRPIHERSRDLQRRKEERMYKAKADALREDPNLTFQPRLSKASRKIAQMALYKEGLVHTDVVKRLEIESDLMLKRREHRVQSILAAEAKECAFVPRVSKNSKKIVESNPQLSKPFLERQEILHREGKRAHRSMENGAPKYTFKPSIGNAEEVLVHTRPQRLSETTEERCERLASKEKARTERLKAFISNQYYSQFDFQPKINEISKALGKSSGGFENLYRNETGRRYKEAKQFEAELAERKECTFKPKINKTSATVDIDAVETSYDFMDPRTVVERIEQDRREKENWMKQQKREQEFMELEECTFSPTVKDLPATKQGPVVVRGLGRYLELRAAAKKKEEDLKERERKVFHQTPRGNTVPFTVPKPFQLSTTNRALRQKYEGEEEEQSSFKPNTLYAARKAQVSKIMSM